MVARLAAKPAPSRHSQRWLEMLGALVQAPAPAGRRLPGGDQRHDRGERHLERGAGQRLGRGEQHDDRRPGDQAERQRRAVEQHGEQGEARHGARRAAPAPARRPARCRTAPPAARPRRPPSWRRCAAPAAAPARCRSAAAPITRATTNTMCRPEIDRMWARPESRMAWVMSLSTAVCSPVSSAAATPPSVPGSACEDALP